MCSLQWRSHALITHVSVNLAHNEKEAILTYKGAGCKSHDKLASCSMYINCQQILHMRVDQNLSLTY